LGNSSLDSPIPSYKLNESEFPLLPKSLKNITRQSSSPTSSITITTPGGTQNYVAAISTPIHRTSGNTQQESPEEAVKFWFKKFILFIASTESDKDPPNPATKANCDINTYSGKEILISTDNGIPSNNGS